MQPASALEVFFGVIGMGTCAILLVLGIAFTLRWMVSKID